MLRRLGLGLGLCGVALLVGCGALGDLLGPSQVTVELVNNGDFDVEARLYVGDNQDTLEDLLTTFGEEINITIPPGETREFTRKCDDLQAIILDNADLRVIGGIGPEANTGVFRDGDDFNCGDRIVFTFGHSALLVDFDVTVSVF